jgi:predicted tellurium resistance membrane protein TerC
MSDDDDKVVPLFKRPAKEEKLIAHVELRRFADLLEVLSEEYGHIEMAAVAFVPNVGVPLCGNSETGRDGMLTMFEIGKTAIVMEYIEGVDEDDETVH